MFFKSPISASGPVRIIILAKSIIEKRPFSAKKTWRLVREKNFPHCSAISKSIQLINQFTYCFSSCDYFFAGIFFNGPAERKGVMYLKKSGIINQS